jgi:hypothetical protein
MPQRAVAGSSRSAQSKDAEENEASESESVPIDIPALCPSGLSPAPVPEFSVQLITGLSIEPDLQSEYFQPPDPKSQSPPGALVFHPLRSPPA